MKTFAQLRKEKGYSQTTLASKLGIDISTVRNLETSSNATKAINRYAELCSILGITIQELAQIKQAQAEKKKEKIVAKYEG